MISDAPLKTLTLTSGDARLKLVPDAGGAIVSWRVGDQAMLHESGELAGPEPNPLHLASFPLVPFSNRIGSGLFLWNGVDYQLPPSNLPDRHTIHGVGSRRKWSVVKVYPERAVLGHDHLGDTDWPWPYAAEQEFRLSCDALEVVMTATNLADMPVPLAFGMHPYFDAVGAYLQFSAGQIWQSGPDNLPTQSETPGVGADFGDGREIAATDLDNCYDSWEGRAAIWWHDRPLALKIESDLPCAVVYTPPSERYFCFEPVPHSNNALQLGDLGQPMPTAAPNEQIKASVRFSVVPREAVE